MEDLQEQFDALVTKHGAEAVIGAVKTHALLDAGCGRSGCPKGYICVNSVCVLDI